MNRDGDFKHIRFKKIERDIITYLSTLFAFHL